jgi:hypothetical protein
MKFVFFLLNLIIFQSNISQFDYLKKYIPYDTSSYITHPIVNLKVWVHIVQKSENIPANFTNESTIEIQKYFKWINQIYATLYPPTLKNSNSERPYLKDSRIRFDLDSISFHVNRNDWDRLKLVEESKKVKWMKILKINSDSGTVLIKGKRERFNPIFDSIIINETRFNNGVFHVNRIKRKESNTLIYLEEDLLVSEDSIGYVSYFKKIDKNCDEDNWIKYTDKNKDYLHVFFTGSSVEAATFGCGPNPFFLNVSKAINNGAFANAQLISHEIGHCLGLRHTNSPQFNDLPKTDKFGWIKCNDKNTSNNIMGYNTCRRYLSPLQIAYIHYRYSNNSALYKSITKDYDSNNAIRIKENTLWDKSIYIQNDIVVKKNQTLTINDKLIMLNEAAIILEKKSTLIVNGGKILSSGVTWKGILKCKSELKKNKVPKKRKNLASIKIINNGEIIY